MAKDAVFDGFRGVDFANIISVAQNKWKLEKEVRFEEIQSSSEKKKKMMKFESRYKERW